MSSPEVDKITHPDFSDWNWCGVNLVTKKVEDQVLALHLKNIFGIHVPSTGTLGLGYGITS